ncbi:MAG: LysM peptidoglycan-binding domain-containing protein, partial [Lachnospiraceae bacterium]|nr:LysM peptidoglycan-binding domain-containing protein [Lachnospiraceae bacterium]
TVTHKVKPGESLASIAKTYNVAPEQIKSWNSLRIIEHLFDKVKYI